MHSRNKARSLLHPHSQIQFHKLLWGSQEGETIPVIRYDTDEGLQLDPTQARILKYLERGAGLNDTAQKTQTTLRQVRELLQTVIASGFVSSIDSKPLPDTFPKIQPLWKHIPQKRFSFLLNPIFLLTLCAFILSGFLLAANKPGYIPTLSNVFWTDDLFLILLIIHTITILTTVFHEFAHYAFTRAFGGHARIRLSTRFVYFVAETDHYHIAVMPKWNRYLIYVSGMCADMLIMACVVWLLYFVRFDSSARDLVFENILKTILILQITGLAWQLNAFVKNDVYNILSELFHQDNLYGNTKKYMTLKLRKIKKSKFSLLPNFLLKMLSTSETTEQTDSFTTLSSKDKLIIAMYAFYVGFATLLSLIFLLYYQVFRDLIIFTRSIETVVTAYSHGSYGIMIKSLFTAVLVIDLYLLTAYLIFKGNKQTKNYL